MDWERLDNESMAAFGKRFEDLDGDEQGEIEDLIAEEDSLQEEA